MPEGEIRRLTTEAGNRLEGIIGNKIARVPSEDPKLYMKGVRVRNPHPKLLNGKTLGKTAGTAVFDLGDFSWGGEKIPMVGKANALRINPGYFFVDISAYDAIFGETMSHILAEEGLPCPLGFKARTPSGIPLLMTLRLGGKGKPLFEAEGFPFEKLKNGEQLKKEFQDWISKLLRLEKEGKILPNRHRSLTDPALCARRSFFVIVDPKTNSGSLVLGDHNNYTIEDSVLKKYPQIRKFWDRAYDRKRL